MHDDTIFGRTDKGREELSTRRHGLEAGARALLQQVDGKRSVRELKQRFSTLMDTAAGLERLRQDGFVEHCAGPGADVRPAPDAVATNDSGRGSFAARLLGAVKSAAPRVADTATTATAATGDTGRALRQRRVQRALRMLGDLLGSEGDMLGLALETARTDEELLVALRQTEHVIQSVRGPAAAVNFRREIDQVAA
jgi:hypothetical protein